MTRLPQDARVSPIDASFLSDAERSRLMAVMCAPGYTGPRLKLVVAALSEEDARKDIKTWMKQSSSHEVTGNILLDMWQQPGNGMLFLSWDDTFTTLPPLPPGVRHLKFTECNDSVEWPDFGRLETLEILELSGDAFERLPDLRGCVALKHLKLHSQSLTVPPDLSGCSALKSLDLDSPSLTTPPDLSSNRELRSLLLKGCHGMTQPPDLSSCKDLSKLKSLIAASHRRLMCQD